MRVPLAVVTAAIVLGVFLAVNLPAPVSRGAQPVPQGTPPVQEQEQRDVASPSSPQAPERALFRPEDLPLLEGPDRALWQNPDLVMDQLRIAEGSKVADIGAGAGWFTIRLARRVGPNGMVYAQDLQHEMVVAIRRRVERERLTNVTVVQGDEDSPNLPHGVLDAVLVVDVYPEVKGRVPFLRSLAASLKPNGRIGIVNYKPRTSGPGPEPSQRIEKPIVEQDARMAGLRAVSTTELKYQYMVVLERENPSQVGSSETPYVRPNRRHRAGVMPPATRIFAASASRKG
jgi:ubiquinone/menaquinone biosynthesis C-methylase UbiE